MTDASIANRAYLVRPLGPGYSEWDYAEAERPHVYADIHHGPIADGRNPIDVARKLWRDLRARRAK